MPSALVSGAKEGRWCLSSKREERCRRIGATVPAGGPSKNEGAFIIGESDICLTSEDGAWAESPPATLPGVRARAFGNDIGEVAAMWGSDRVGRASGRGRGEIPGVKVK